MFARRGGISLFDGTRELYGISLKGTNNVQVAFSGDPFVEEYVSLKEFINLNFMTPMVEKKMELVKLNAFNFEYLSKKLHNYKLVFKDAEMFIKLIDSIRAAIEISDENEKLNEIVYGNSKETSLVFKTTAVEFKPEYQIYLSIFGKPETFEEFNEGELTKIKGILDSNPTLPYRELITKLGLDPDEIKKIEKMEKKKTIDWEDLPDDPQKRREMRLKDPKAY